MTERDESVSGWMGRLKAGDLTALEPLWERYFHRLVGLARVRLGKLGRGAGDEEDVALDAMDSLCRGVARGRFPRLDDREDLWRLLVCITTRKAAHLRERENRLKRGGAGVRATDAAPELDRVLSEEPTPEMAALLGEESQRLLEALGDDTLRRVALLKMEGFTTPEIARRLDAAPRTVERKLQIVRAAWSAVEQEDASGGG